MDRLTTIKAAVCTAAAALTAFWGWTGWLAAAWFLAMLLDYATGSAAALRAGTWSSRVAREGLWHKAGAVAGVLVAALLDFALRVLLGSVPGLGIDYDVLLCPEDVDEFCMMAMGTYGEHAVDGDEENKQPYFIKNVGSEDLGLTTDEEKKEAEEATESNAELFGIMQEALDGKVERVVVSTRLTDAPAVVTSEGGMSLAMVQVLKSQPGTDELPEMHLVLEVNAKHPVFATLQAAHEAGDDEKVRTYAGLLFDQALLVEGILPDNPLAFAQAVAELMK